MGQITFRTYRPRPPLTKAEVRKRAVELQRRLAGVLYDRNADPDELWVAVRDAWWLLGYVAGPVADSARQKWTDKEIISAARSAATQVESEAAALGKTLELLQASRPQSHTLSVQALKKRLLRLGRFVTLE